MKRFSKILIVLTLILITLSMTACSNVGLTASKYLWFNNPSAFKSNFKEVLVYDLSFVNTTNANSDPVKVDGCLLDIDQGSYVTTLETKTDKNGNYYIYSTEFNLKAKYVTPSETREFVDTFNTVTRFDENLTPISTIKHYNSEYSNYKYDYEIIYEGDKATATLKESGLNNENLTENTFTFKKYNKGAFIDNDTILLMPRLYDVSNSFIQEFKTIDVLSNKNHNMQFYAYLVDNKVDVKNLDGYTLNGQPVSEDKLACNHIQIVIKADFAGSPIECYYAQDRDTNRHRLVETFTRFGSIGYIKYKLVTATVENDN